MPPRPPSPCLLYIASGAAVAGFVLSVALRRHRRKRCSHDAATMALEPERDLIGYGAEAPKACWPGGE